MHRVKLRSLGVFNRSESLQQRWPRETPAHTKTVTSNWTQPGARIAAGRRNPYGVGKVSRDAPEVCNGSSQSRDPGCSDE